MREVLEQTRLLGEAILNSDIYRRVQAANEAMENDPATCRLVSAYMAARNEVQALLGDEVDPEALAEAGRAVEEAEAAMNAAPLVIEAREASAAYSKMMDNVNQLLKLLLTGDSGSGGCTGSCETCGGCG